MRRIKVNVERRIKRLVAEAARATVSIDQHPDQREWVAICGQDKLPSVADFEFVKRDLGRALTMKETRLYEDAYWDVLRKLIGAMPRSYQP